VNALKFNLLICLIKPESDDKTGMISRQTIPNIDVIIIITRSDEHGVSCEALQEHVTKCVVTVKKIVCNDIRDVPMTWRAAIYGR